MNCIIVDDDLFSTKILSAFIERTPSLLTLRKFDNAIDAINFINQAEQRIDIIFLDIEMPEMTGIDFIKSIKTDAQIIINTTQEKYALVSYEYDVCDYLLKPATYARFLKAVGKAEKEASKHNSQVNTLPPKEDCSVLEASELILESPDVAFIKDVSGALYRIDMTAILYIEAMENYVSIHTANKRFTVHCSLKDVTERLTDRYIVRTHKSYAVGFQHIKVINSSNVTLDTNNIQVPIGRVYRDQIKSIVCSLRPL